MKLFTFTFIFTLLGFIITIPNSLHAQNILKKVVIDAGHGGKDPGASGKYSREKDVVLAVALKTGKLIKQKYPDIEIIYTRKTDVFIPLKERAEIANRNKADLFISIHCNSNASSQPHGSETYVMGLHKSEANLNVAKKENSAMLFEDNYEQQYDGFDPTTDESHIIFNFFQNSFLEQNLDFASLMQSEFTVNTPLRNRGVKQAGFWVLYKTTMPGVLIETGFLSNAKDEKFLTSKDGQQRLSRAIANAVSEYKKAHDAVELKKSKTSPTDVAAANKIKVDLKDTTEKKTQKKLNENIPIFKIQFISLSTQKTLTGKKYDGLPVISSYKHKGLYRYTSGHTQNYDKAVKLQAQVRKAGFKDAFIVAFLNDERISLKKARKLIK